MKKSWILLTACAALLSGVEAIACTGLLGQEGFDRRFGND